MPLSIELQANKVFVVGTIMISRIGYATEVIDKRAKKPQGEGKGAFRLAVNKRVPAMVALSWMDSKPVHF
ncbi:hypothetical protein PI124_g21253 [Phytophthora idaei]|nr:hypothetical protein PI125_g21165 [Phytophthora idaei]KAG3129352.1 hypothetical protein PI126_g21014 [Phytophthora idaei]KAG3233675.1 hypothetical protein PI124_g21253 [Phytophthora idaei]